MPPHVSGYCSASPLAHLHFSLDQRNAAGIPPLFQAAMRGDVEVVEELGRGGAELDGCVVSGDFEYSNPIGHDEHTGRCPLWIAVRHHHVGVVQALVRLGADVSKRSAGTAQGDTSMDTPLLLAADVCVASELTEDSTSAAINVLRLLLEAGKPQAPHSGLPRDL